jgi:hypothetical protein
MVAINFTVFQDRIIAGDKRQTIRRTARCQPGDRLQLYTGMRTKACRKLGEAVCTRIERVIIPAPPLTHVMIGEGRVLRGKALEGFAQGDGFSCRQAFFAFFAQHYTLPFEGVVISWGDFQSAERPDGAA